jgi:hypothetical protein
MGVVLSVGGEVLYGSRSERVGGGRCPIREKVGDDLFH